MSPPTRHGAVFAVPWPLVPLLGWCEEAFAHGYAALYTPPVPVALYGWGAAATLVVSFLIAALFLRRPPAPPRAEAESRDWLPLLGPLKVLMPVLRGLVVLALGLAIATAYFGSRDPLRNFGMTWFWILFVLGVPYASLLVGNFYAALNGWRTLTDGMGRLWRGYTQGRFVYPERLGDWPALLLYLGFIHFELFSTGQSVALGHVLLGYTVLNLVGVGLVGRDAWFRHCEFFSLFLRLFALLAPVDYQRGEHGQPSRLRLRWPLAGLMQERPERLSTVVFVLAMLATTAFDGLRATQWWVMLFWGDPTGWLTAWRGVPPIAAIGELRPWYVAWETLWVFTLPFVYFAAYALAIGLGRLLTGYDRPLRELALDFAYSLLPIAVVYHLTHYLTLLLAHGLKIVSLLSDPFGRKWDLFGTAHLWRAPILLDYSLIWHGQVVLILAGHIASAVVAHRIALRVFPSHRSAWLSQLPMLGLMVAVTVVGLWIIAQPLTMVLLR